MREIKDMYSWVCECVLHLMEVLETINTSQSETIMSILTTQKGEK